MPRKLFRKYLPDPEKMKAHKSLRFLGELLSDPNLWHINRRSLAGAAFIGIFCGFLPIPFQMAVAGLLALRFRCNLPFSVVLVWFSNPVTYVPVFYFTYRIGAWILDTPPSALGRGGLSLANITDLDWLANNMPAVWEAMLPLWLGSLLCGLFFGGLFWVAIRVGWRITIVRLWQERRRRRRRARADEKNVSRP